MKPKRIPRPALPPRGLRPKLQAGQVLELGICHMQTLDAIASGEGTADALWQIAGAALTWSKVAELLRLGEPEMNAQLELALALIERHARTGRVLFTGSEYQLAKAGTVVMDQLAEAVDHATAVIAAEWSERRLADIVARSRERQSEAV